MRHRLSPSKLKLAEACMYWARPDVIYDDQPTGKKARIGTLVHRMAEAIAAPETVTKAHTEDLDEVAEALSIVNGPLKGWLETWRSEDVPRHVEVSLRYDVETGAVRSYPRRGKPGYERPGMTEMGGEMDLVRCFGDVGEIVDLKTGDPRWFADSQLFSYGVMGAAFFGWKRVRVAFLRALKTKVSMTPWVELDTDALDEQAGKMRRMLRVLPTAPPQPGEHCWLCDARKAGVCPAHHEVTEDDREEAFAF